MGVAGPYRAKYRPGGPASGGFPADIELVVVEGTPATVSLAVARLADGQVRLSWPATAVDLVLPTTPLPGGWADSQATVVTEGDQRLVMLAPTDQARFFRLARP